MWDVIFETAVVTLNSGVTTARAGPLASTLDRSRLTPSQRAAVAEMNAIEEIEQIKQDHQRTMRQMAAHDRAVRAQIKAIAESRRNQRNPASSQPLAEIFKTEE